MSAVTVEDPLPHVEHPDTVGRRWRAGVVLLIVADASFVFSLVFSYFYLRGLNTAGHWVGPDSPIAPIWVGWAIAAGLILSAAAYMWGQAGLRSGLDARLRLGAAVALAVLVLVTVAQLVQIGSLPFGVADSAYASSVYVLASANLFHMLLTLFVGLGLWNRARLGRYSAGNDWQVRVIGLWWMWVAVAAAISAVPMSFIASPGQLLGG